MEPIKKALIRIENKISPLTLLFLIVLSANTIAQNDSLNNGFEQGTLLDTDHWSKAGLGSGRSSSYAASGEYSMAVWNWYSYVEGRAVNGDIEASQLNFPIKNGGTPFVHTPEFINGFYLYDTTNTISENDSAMVEIVLKKYNLITESIDTVGYGEIHLPATNMSQSFKPFQIAIENKLPGVTPDSIVVLLRSALNGCCNGLENNECLYFYVDELEASLSAGISVPLNEQKVHFWPNPVENEISIILTHHKTGLISIIDLSGKIWISEVPYPINKLDISHLPKGPYLIMIDSDGETYTKKFIKN